MPIEKTGAKIAGTIERGVVVHVRVCLVKNFHNEIEYVKRLLSVCSV